MSAGRKEAPRAARRRRCDDGRGVAIQPPRRAWALWTPSLGRAILSNAARVAFRHKVRAQRPRIQGRRGAAKAQKSRQESSMRGRKRTRTAPCRRRRLVFPIHPFRSERAKAWLTPTRLWCGPAYTHPRRRGCSLPLVKQTPRSHRRRRPNPEAESGLCKPISCFTTAPNAAGCYAAGRFGDRNGKAVVRIELGHTHTHTATCAPNGGPGAYN